MHQAAVSDINALNVFQCLGDECINKLAETAFKVKLSKGEILFAEKDIVNKIYIVITGKVTMYRQLKNTVPLKMDKKLVAKLWKLCKDYGKKCENGTVIDLNVSITYLADMLGSTRETISRSMAVLEKNGLVKTEGKKILVKDSEKLSIYFRGK